MTDRPSHRQDGTADDAPAATIEGYRMLRVIGHGGMSTVFLARDDALGRDVAVKVMLPEALADETSRRRFENETRTIARLEHPHIVGIYQVGRTREGLPYYAMPYLRRGHVGQRDFSRNHASARNILRALLQALDYAHARGVVHRDVKAENVLFDEAERPLLADFGIALRRGYGTRVTTAGLAVGSTAYMAPEQARGQNVDARADLYAVGVLAWEMLTGALPFMAEDALSMAIKHAQDPIPRLPPEMRHWQRFFDRALAKSPAQRFQNAQQMLEAMQQVPMRRGRSFAGGIANALRRMREVPRGVWIGFVLAAAALAGIALHDLRGTDDGFYRSGASAPSAATRGDGLPIPTQADGAILPADPTDALLRSAPESAAERLVLAAESDLRQGRLTAPPGDNAYDGLLAAWRADRAHLRLPPSIAALADALSNRAARRIASNDAQGARDDAMHLQRLLRTTAPAGEPARARAEQRIAGALRQRIDAEVARGDRVAAARTAGMAGDLGLDAATATRLRMHAGAPAEVVVAQAPGTDGSTVLRSGNARVAAAHAVVTRADYAAFATATSRTPALCRERASLLRIVAPRTWQSPGFQQAAGQPVVCVSWGDADAYARWMSERTGLRYRLPTGDEARAVARNDGTRAVAEWVRDCDAGCRRHLTTGRSWRGASGNRALEADRGYDDVGFRLVREL